MQRQQSLRVAERRVAPGLPTPQLAPQLVHPAGEVQRPIHLPVGPQAPLRSRAGAMRWTRWEPVTTTWMPGTRPRLPNITVTLSLLRIGAVRLRYRSPIAAMLVRTREGLNACGTETAAPAQRVHRVVRLMEHHRTGLPRQRATASNTQQCSTRRPTTRTTAVKSSAAVTAPCSLQPSIGAERTVRTQASWYACTPHSARTGDAR